MFVCCCWSLLHSAILCSWADSLYSYVILLLRVGACACRYALRIASTDKILRNYALIPARQSVIRCTHLHDVTNGNLPDLSATPALKKAYLSVSLSLSSCEHWSATSQWKQKPAQHAHNNMGKKMEAAIIRYMSATWWRWSKSQHYNYFALRSCHVLPVPCSPKIYSKLKLTDCN